ncbi:MAG: PTS sugar transporter subunit IIA [Candidatus Aminicenantes bacterium]|nr:PTS sugar transporter subunit IIA [Candidatus Aminicenantes bacterium]
MIGNRADSFLRLIRRSQRGKLKIYLGYCAGVGKTFQMLQDGHRLAAEGIDVVIGYVEPHGRAETQALTAGLEAVPRRKTPYRGIDLEEMDLDAVLARRPAVVLVDELAHTNVPGGRNEKRFQDVEEILAAGIHVVSTLNIQHLESLYNMVEGAVGVKVRERVPDKIVLDADQIVNVDVTTEDLLKRLGEGKIYPRERISSALASFFRAENLEQLRELTLRELASQIDVRRRDPGHEESRSGLDQVLVCLGSRGPNSEALLRYGSRLAGRLNRNWYALYVQTPNENPELIDAQTQRILSNTLALARRLGATVFTYKGENVVETILRFAREYRIGHIVIGRPRPVSRMKRLIGRRDVAECLIRQARGLTVVVADNRVEAIGTVGEGAAPLVREAMEDSRPASKSAFEQASIRAVIWREPMAKEEAYRKLLHQALAGSPGIDEARVWDILRSREAQGSTYLAEDLALPHARIEGLDEPILGVASAAKGIHEPETGRVVRIVFLLLSPVQPSDCHVRLLAELGSMARDDAFMQGLAAAPNPREIVDRVRATLLGA